MFHNCEGQSPQTTTFEVKGEPKQIRAEIPLLTSLPPYRQAKPAHAQEVLNYGPTYLYIQVHGFIASFLIVTRIARLTHKMAQDG